MEKSGAGMAIEQVIASDDSLLPAPSELAAYQNVDAQIIPWLLEQTKKEQEHRHHTDNDKIKLMQKALNMDRLYLVCLFLFALLFVLLSALFVYLEKNIAGSIFGFFGIVGVIVLFSQLKLKK